MVSASLALLHGDGDFSWGRFPVHTSVLIGCIALSAGYLYAIGPLRRKHGLAERADPIQTAFFLSGILILFISLNGPIHELSDFYLFSAHMVQHLLLTLIMPPLLLIGLPAWLVQPPRVLGDPSAERRFDSRIERDARPVERQPSHGRTTCGG